VTSVEVINSSLLDKLFDFFYSNQEAMAEEQRMAARYVNDIEIAKAQRDYELKKAAFDQEVQTKKAQSEMAYALQVINNCFLTPQYACFHDENIDDKY
jgi:hypothetical protein